MGYLSNNWLTKGLIDFEYKKYIILSYLKEVQQHFSDKKLYPVLAELIEHLQNLELLKKNKGNVNSSFPKSVEGLDMENLSIQYKPKIEDSDTMQELDAIIEFALSLFKDHAKYGQELYDEIKDSITIEPIGITPLYTEEGFLFLTQANLRTIRIYKYLISPIRSVNHSGEEVKTSFFSSKEKSVLNTFENIKREIIKRDSENPNPAAYSIHSNSRLPLTETYLPIAKALLLSQVAA